MTQDDLGGVRGIFPAAYAVAIFHDCPTCGAQIWEQCTNPLTGREKAAPCVARGKERTGV